LTTLAGPELLGREAEGVVFGPTIAALLPILGALQIVFVRGAMAAVDTAFSE
jgi:hypothetical protein